MAAAPSTSAMIQPRTVRSLTHSAHSTDRQLLLADARVGRGWVLVRLIAPPARPSRRGTRSRCR